MANQPNNMPVRRASADSEMSAGIASADFLSRLPEKVAIVRMENDSMISMAMSQPRDYGQIVEDVKAQLRASKRFALAAMYSKPVGKFDKCPACGRETFYKDNCPGCGALVPQKYATGLGVRATESMQTAYGHLKIVESVEELPGGEKVKVTCQVCDFSSGIIIVKDMIVSKVYKTRKGELKAHDDDRFFNVVLKAKVAILRRDSVMQIIPPAIRYEMEDCIEEEREKYLDDATVNKIVSNFAEKGVSAAMLEAHFGKRLANFTKAERGRLASIWTSLEDEEMTVEGIFGSDSDRPTKASADVERIKSQLNEQKQAAHGRTAGAPEAPAKTPPVAPAQQAPARKREPAPAKVAPQAPKAAPVVPTPPPPAPEPDPVMMNDPLAPDPAVKMPETAPEHEPQEGPEIDAGAIYPSGDTGEAASGQPAQEEPASASLFPGADDAEPEPDMDQELRDEAFKEIKAVCARLNQKGSAKGAKVMSELLGATGKMVTAMKESGCRGIKSPDQYSLDAMNDFLQRLAQIEAWVDEQK